MEDMEMNQTPASEPIEASQPVAEEATQETAEATPAEATTNELGQEPKEDSESSADENDYVEDENGNKFIPADKVQAIVAKRLAQMADQKNNAVESFLQSVSSNPEAKRQVMEALGLSGENPSPKAQAEGTPEPAAFDSWLTQNVQPEFHAHYKQMAEAQWSTVMPHIRKMIDEAINPVVGYIGKQTVSSFKASHPDYAKYESQIQSLVSSGRAKTIEDAYILASHGDKLKGVGSAAVKQEKARQSKLASNPTRRFPGASGSTTPKITNARDAVEAAARKLGYK